MPWRLETQVRGRITGPRCAYATTVEVAYPLRESSREYYKDGVPRITSRVLIPEPNLWDPISPFLYLGKFELWQSDQCCDQAERTIHLEQISLGTHGLRWNGKPLTLRGVARDTDLECDALELRRAGYNSVVTSVAQNSHDIWEKAERLGLSLIHI